MQSEIKRELIEKSKRQFGDARTEELQADIDKVATELAAIHEYPLTIDDEP